MRQRMVLVFLLLLATTAAFAQAPRDVFRAAVDGRRLVITGTGRADAIVAVVHAETIAIEHRLADGSAPSQTATFRLGTFDRLELSAGAGADFVNIIDPGQVLDAQRTVLALDGGEGDNIVAVTHAPFRRETAERLRALLDLSTRLEDLAARASDAATSALANDAMTIAERFRTSIADEAQALARDVESQLLVPGRTLVERDVQRAVDTANAAVSRVHEIEVRHAQLVTDLQKSLDAMSGPRLEDVREPPRGVEPSAPEPDPDRTVTPDHRARIDAIAADALGLGTGAQSNVETAANEIVRAARDLERRAEELAARAERLAETSERMGDDAERDLTASTDRVLAIIGELRAITSQIADASTDLRAEIRRAVSTTSPQPDEVATRTGASCGPIATTHTFNGGSGFDFFFPAAFINSSWSISGGAGFNILFGGLAADDIRGGPNVDWIFGLRGNDLIHGGAGVDLLAGEFVFDLFFVVGKDCVWGEDGVDFLFGDNVFAMGGTVGRDDSLWGGNGVDVVFGDDGLDFLNNALPGGADAIEGNDGIDILLGCGGADDISGNDDIDFIAGNGGADVIRGHPGRAVQIANTTVDIGNLLIGGPGADEIHGDLGVDVILGGEGGDRMFGEGQLDLMFGGGGADDMKGHAGGVIATINNVPIRLGNLMFGNRGGDTMLSGGDLDVMLGQADDDDVRGYDGIPQLGGIDLDVILGGGENDYLEGDDEPVVSTKTIDLIFGGAGSDRLFGGRDVDLLFGGAGDDTIDGDSSAVNPLLASSVDFVHGGDGDDDMNGGTSVDLLFGRAGKDTIDGDTETPLLISPDLIFGGDDDDVLHGGVSIDLILGGDGADTITGDSNFGNEAGSLDLILGEGGNDDIDGGNALDLLFGQAGCDTVRGDDGTSPRVSPDFIFGGADDDVLRGGISIDFIWAGEGHDTVAGEEGVDFLWGNEGCDSISGGAELDFAWGGGGADRVDGDGGPDLLWGNENGDTMSGGPQLDLIWGNEGNDTIHGDSASDLLWGNDGNDCLFGDDGKDVLFGGEGDDCIRGGDQTDLLMGNQGSDRLYGEDGNDLAFGNEGDDQLDGGPKADFLHGGDDTDEAWGGPGWDVMFAETKHQSGSNPNGCSCATESCTGTICVRKFDDVNGNGVQNAGEAPLAGWAFDVVCGCRTTRLVTGADGTACATFFAGTCTVTEATQSGWTPTTATTQTVNVTGGQTSSVAFGNRRVQKGELCIRKFHDRDGDGVQDPNEPGLAGFVFHVSGGGVVQTVTTSANGTWCIGLASGVYTITEQPRPGWIATTPATQTVTLAPAALVNVSFGNRQ